MVEHSLGSRTDLNEAASRSDTVARIDRSFSGPNGAAAAFFLLLREGLSRFFTEYYLIPVGLIFIAMVIFMPQGLLGFMRRWLNR